MQIRPYRPPDAVAVNAVALASFEQYKSVYSDWEVLARGVGAMAALAEQADIIVADESYQVVGAVAYCPPGSSPRATFFEPEWPIIRMLVVDPRVRGRGIGRKLTEECINRARNDGASVISLHTSPVMKVALSMYLKMGFELTRHVPDRFGAPYAVYTLRL